MKDIIILLAMLSFTIYSFYLFFKEYKNYKKEKDEFIKLFYELMVIVLIIPEVIYFLDIYNIPSKFNLINDINTSDWLNFIGTYSSGIMATIISAYFLIYMTMKQINRTFEDNQDLNKENSRLQNLPFIEYNITSLKSNKTNRFQEIYLDSKYENDCSSLYFSLILKNIGLNSIRKTFIKFTSELLVEECNFELDGQSIIEKESCKILNFHISKVPSGNYMLKFKIIYQDLLKNWYEQNVEVGFDLTDIYISNSRKFKSNIKVLEEKRIKKPPEWIDGKTNKKIAN